MSLTVKSVRARAERLNLTLFRLSDDPPFNFAIFEGKLWVATVPNIACINAFMDGLEYGRTNKEPPPCSNTH